MGPTRVRRATRSPSRAPGSPFAITGAAGFDPCAGDRDRPDQRHAVHGDGDGDNGAALPGLDAAVLNPVVTASPASTGPTAVPGPGRGDRPELERTGGLGRHADRLQRRGHRGRDADRGLALRRGRPGDQPEHPRAQPGHALQLVGRGAVRLAGLLGTGRRSGLQPGRRLHRPGHHGDQAGGRVGADPGVRCATAPCAAEGWTTVPGLGDALPAAGPGTIPDLEDPARFAEYPFPSPATYPTRCGIDMGTAQLVTTGAACWCVLRRRGSPQPGDRGRHPGRPTRRAGRSTPRSTRPSCPARPTSAVASWAGRRRSPAPPPARPRGGRAHRAEHRTGLIVRPAAHVGR